MNDWINETNLKEREETKEGRKRKSKKRRKKEWIIERRT